MAAGKDYRRAAESAAGPVGKLRILRINSWDGSPGGAEEYIREVTDELGRRGHETRILQITASSGTLPPPLGRTLPRSAGRLARLGEDIVVRRETLDALGREMREFAPDLVSLHHFDARFASLARGLSNLEVPIVVAAHDAELVCPISTLVRPGGIVCDGGVRFRCLFTGCHVGLGGPYNLWQTRVFDAALRDRVAAYLCPSRSLTDYLHANGYRPALHLPSFARIPESVRAAPPPPAPPAGPPTVGYIGRLEWYKGLDDLLRAVAQLVPRLPTIRLDVAGDGPFEPRLRRLADELGISEHVTWRGRVERDAKEGWFSGIHVAAVPSNMWENFPLVALESLVRGRPVVATRIGGIPDIVEDGLSGRLVPIDDPVSLAEALASLLTQPDEAHRMGQTGRARVLERFTPDRHVERLLAVYRAVLGHESLMSGSEASALVEPAP